MNIRDRMTQNINVTNFDRALWYLAEMYAFELDSSGDAEKINWANFKVEKYEGKEKQTLQDAIAVLVYSSDGVPIYGALRFLNTNKHVTVLPNIFDYIKENIAIKND